MSELANEYNRMTLDEMIWQITMNSNYTEKALVKMSDEKIIELYQVKVLKEQQS